MGKVGGNMEPSRCNRCGAWVYDGAPLCPNCALRYKEVYNNTPRVVVKSEIKKRIPKPIKVILGISTLIILLLSFYVFGNGKIFNRLEFESFPPHAQVFEFDEELFQTMNTSPIILETDDNYAYFVKIIDQDNENTILSVFLHPNETYEIEIPVGMYRIEYMFGKRWENILTYFGNTQSMLIEENLSFTQENGYHINLGQNKSIQLGFILFNLFDCK